MKHVIAHAQGELLNKTGILHELLDQVRYVIEITLKLRFSEKVTKLDEISILVLTLLSDVKTKIEISSNFVAFS